MIVVRLQFGKMLERFLLLDDSDGIRFNTGRWRSMSLSVRAGLNQTMLICRMSHKWSLMSQMCIDLPNALSAITYA